jgi:dTDP-glucose 4,6-dehydratase
MRTVLLTGAGGFLGHHCLEYWLANTDWRIVAVDMDWPRAFPFAVSERVVIITEDLSKRMLSHQAFRRDKIIPDVIVNAASVSHVDTSIENPVETWRNNTALAVSMLEFARSVKPRLFVQTSTDEVYGPVQPGFLGFAPWDQISPSNPYSASKAAQEALAFSYWRTYRVPVVITNCVNMFGERQKSEKFIPKVVKRLLDKLPVEVHADAAGRIGSRWWTHAANYAAFVVWLSHGESASNVRPDRWHLSGQEQITNLEMVQKIAAILGVSPQVEVVDAEACRPGHDLHYGLDGSDLTSAGWKYPVQLRDSLEKTVRWYADNPGWFI